MTTFRKQRDMNYLKNLNRKCGEITFCTQVGKRVYTLNCLYCPQICLQWDVYIHHMEEEHDDDLNFDPVLQAKNDETEIQMDHDESQEKITPLNDKLDESDAFGFDDPLEGESSTSQKCLENSIKIENVECLPNLNLFDNIAKQIEADMGKSELSIMTEDTNKNFNNMFQNSSNLTTLQKEFNNSFSEGQNVMPPVTLQAMMATISKTIEPMFIRLTNEVTSLLQDINNLHKDVKELRKDKSIVNLMMPKTPYKEMEDFLNFDKKLQEDSNFLISIEKELLTVAKDPNFTRNCWRKLLVDELAEKLCWKGTEEKKSVRSLCIAKAIRNAAIFIGLDEEVFLKSTKSFFQFAKNRQELRKKYRAKQKTNN